MRIVTAFSFSLLLGCSSPRVLVSSGIKPNEPKLVSNEAGGGSLEIGPELSDPLEEDPKYKPIFAQVDLETVEALKRKGIEPQLGYCHAFWATKKKILRTKYNIDWKTPSELNPFTHYD